MAASFIEAGNYGGHSRAAQSAGRAGRRNHDLKAPAQSAACTGLGRRVGLQLCAEILVGLAVPDVAQRLLRGITKCIVLIALLRERRDAAWQRPPVGGEIHDRPGTPAERPGIVVGLAPKAFARLGRTRGIEANAEFGRLPFGSG